MIIELHAHTHYSRGEKVLYDGLDSPQEMVKQAKAKGIGMLAITDHNHMAGLKEAREAGKKAGILIIPGEEVGTTAGHMIGLGLSEAIPPGLTAEETADKIREQGAFSIAPHPFDIKMDGLRRKALLCDAVETFNPFNFDRISNWRAHRFAERNGIKTTAGSDAHSKELVGWGTVEAEVHDVDDALKALRKGAYTSNARYPPLSCIKAYAVGKLQKSYGHTRTYIDENYKFPKDLISTGMLKLVHMSPGHIDILFDTLAYTAFGGVVLYSAAIALADA